MNSRQKSPGNALWLKYVLCAFLLAPGLLLPQIAMAQQPAAEARQPTRSWDGIMDIEFDGGTVNEFIKAIEDATAEAGESRPLNIIVARDAGEFVLPAIRIRTTLDGALRCLESCSTDRQRLVITWSSINHIRLVAEYPSVIEVLNVKSILEETPHEDFSSAIAIGMEFAGSNTDEIDMKLHDETGLLFVKGPRDRIQLIQRIVSQLGGPTSDSDPMVGGLMRRIEGGRARGNLGLGGRQPADENASGNDPAATPEESRSGRSGGNRRRGGGSEK